MSDVIKRLDKCLIQLNESTGNYFDHSTNSADCYNEKILAQIHSMYANGVGTYKKVSS